MWLCRLQHTQKLGEASTLTCTEKARAWTRVLILTAIILVGHKLDVTQTLNHRRHKSDRDEPEKHTYDNCVAM